MDGLPPRGLLASGRTRLHGRTAPENERGKDPTRSGTNEDVQTKARDKRHVDEVVLWRREQLAQVGFSLPLAARVADDARYDLHALIELVERGCSPDLAARILAPLEREPDAA